MSTKMSQKLRIILILSVVLRICSALYQGNRVEPLPGVADQISYHELATRVLEGHGFSFGQGWWPATPANHPTAHWSFLYVLFLSGVYSLFGTHPLAARLIQAVLAGILQPLLAWRIGNRLFDSRIGIISAALSSIYAYFVFYGGALMTESFYVLAFLWSLDIATEMAAVPDSPPRSFPWRLWTQLGIAFALAMLFRQVFLFLVPIVLLWILWQRAKDGTATALPRALGGCVLCLVTLSICIAPWTIRNYRVFHKFVLLNTNSGFACFWANHPVQGRNFKPLLPAEEYAALIPAELRTLNEAEMDRELLRRGLHFAMDDGFRFLQLSASRTREFFKFWPSSGSSLGSNMTRMLSSGFYLPLVSCGVICLWRLSKRNRADSSPGIIHPGASLLILSALVYTVIHLMSWTLIRYRLPLDAISAPLASFAVVAGYERIKKSWPRLFVIARHSIAEMGARSEGKP
jgi:4-amino-4-deoxy-L-arabinose transferase-like glycosyltransferase